MVKTVALAERRNIHLNETQAKRVEIARRRQRQFVAKGRCQDNEMLMKKCILNNVPKCIDINPILLNEMKETRRAMEIKNQEKLIKLKEKSKRAKTQPDLFYPRNKTPDNLLKESENRPISGQFRAKFPDKEVILTDVMPPSYKQQMDRQARNLKNGPMFGQTKAKTFNSFKKPKVSQRNLKIENANDLSGKTFIKSIHNYKLRSKTCNNIPRLPDAIKILQTQ